MTQPVTQAKLADTAEGSSQSASQPTGLFLSALLCSTSPPAETRLTVYRRSQHCLLGHERAVACLLCMGGGHFPNLNMFDAASSRLYESSGGNQVDCLPPHQIWDIRGQKAGTASMVQSTLLHLCCLWWLFPLKTQGVTPGMKKCNVKP